MSGIIGTGGHIDHGKTALVAALTGEDTDRLPEEKQRGISIDLGFSQLELDGARHGIVDVPGHEDFIRNMLAGATGTDVLLLAVAADEGVMPQTREHVAIADLLDIPAAVVALTKADLVDDEFLELARDDVAGFLARTRFAGAPIIPVASPEGEGIEALRQALARALGGARRRTDDLFRLPVDRAFTVRGTGTVVTGTVWSGSLGRDETVRLEPGAREARVRGIQVHGRDVERVEAGQRAAVALTGVDRADAGRGLTLVTDAAWRPGSILTARLAVLPDTDWSIRQRQRVRVHLGTAEVMARVRLLQHPNLHPGETGWAQLRLEAPLLARARDRCIIRSYSPVTTIAGAIVAEPDAPKRKRPDPATLRHLEARVGPDPNAAVRAGVAGAGALGAGLPTLPTESGATPAEVERALADDTVLVAAGRAFPASAAADVERGLLAAVEAHHARWPLRPGIEQEELRRSANGDAGLVQRVLDRLLEAGAVENRDGRIAVAGYEVPPDPDRDRRVAAILAALERAGLEAPDREALSEAAGAGDDPLDELLRFMEARGSVVRLPPGIHVHRAVIDRLAAAVRQRLGGRSGLGPADFRDVAAVSRKHLIPLLEYLDTAGVTVRQGEGRSVPAGSTGA